jgi:Uma2 family endonuclease
MTDRQMSALQAERAALWPPGDTEESVLGTNLHQTTITNARLGLNEIAASLAEPGQPAPWQALSQTMLSGPQRYDGSSYTVLPDVFVYPHPVDARRASVTLAREGPPVLVIEVASESTFTSDIDVERGKGWSYAHAGVDEYMVVDPIGDFVPEGVRAWRLEGGVYRPWQAEGDGRWHSRGIAATIALEGAQVAVYRLDGRRMLREGEITRELARAAQAHAEELAQKDAELAALRRLLEQRMKE